MKLNVHESNQPERPTEGWSSCELDQLVNKQEVPDLLVKRLSSFMRTIPPGLRHSCSSAADPHRRPGGRRRTAGCPAGRRPSRSEADRNQDPRATSWTESPLRDAGQQSSVRIYWVWILLFRNFIFRLYASYLLSSRCFLHLNQVKKSLRVYLILNAAANTTS